MLARTSSLVNSRPPYQHAGRIDFIDLAGTSDPFTTSQPTCLPTFVTHSSNLSPLHLRPPPPPQPSNAPSSKTKSLFPASSSSFLPRAASRIRHRRTHITHRTTSAPPSIISRVPASRGRAVVWWHCCCRGTVAVTAVAVTESSIPTSSHSSRATFNPHAPSRWLRHSPCRI